MKNYRTIENIANGLNAVVKIKNLREAKLREDTNTEVRPSDLHIITEVLNTLADYSPTPNRDALKRSVHQSHLYSSTFKNLKQHLEISRNKKPSIGEIVKTLEIMKPMLPNDRTILVEKILKIYNIINS